MWVRFANVKVSKLGNSSLIFFEASIQESNNFTFTGEVRSDLQFFLSLPPQIPKNASLKSPAGQGLIVLVGKYGDGKSVVFNVSGDALFNAGYVEYHSPIAILNIFLNLKRKNEVLATRFIPFAVYVHDFDIVDFDKFWEKCTPYLQDVLRYIHDSEEGDYYQCTKEHKKNMLVYKEKSILVFGKDSDSKNLSEMCQVRDYLKTKGYEAYLLKELPEHPLMSNEEKAKFWALASRFCVMIDREPSGHIAEYNHLKGERVILAFLRPKGEGSTYMIGDDGIEVNYVKKFEFETSPLQVIDDAISWAEVFIRKKIKALSDMYPWRKRHNN